MMEDRGIGLDRAADQNRVLVLARREGDRTVALMAEHQEVDRLELIVLETSLPDLIQTDVHESQRGDILHGLDLARDLVTDPRRAQDPVRTHHHEAARRPDHRLARALHLLFVDISKMMLPD